MSTTAEDFASTIMAFASKAQLAAIEKPAELTREILAVAINSSPYLGHGRFAKGHFMANWKIGSTRETGEIAGTATKDQMLARMKTIITDDYFARNRVVYMVNNVSYANAVETGEGWRYTEGYAPVATTKSAWAGIVATMGGT